MARRRPPIWIVLAAAAYLAYFALLVYCHVTRPGGILETGDLTRSDAILFAFRAVQLITLVFGIVLALRRPDDPAAVPAAWLLATAGVFSVALPGEWAAVWRSLPLLAGAALWFPFLSTLVAGAILFYFAAQFTRDARASSPRALAGLALLVGVPLAWRAVERMSMVYGWQAPAPRLRTAVGLVLANAAPAGVAIFLLLRHYNTAPNLIERRRAHVVLTGGSIGMLSGIAVMIAAAANGSHPDRSLFASTTMTVGTLLFLLFPLSLAYAILRYRLFQWSRAIRLGLRYAIARRALLSFVPLAALLVTLDVWSYGDRPFREIVSARSGVYWMLGGLALAAHLTRHRWLDLLDRTFFREVYDAKRILIDLVGEVRAAKKFEEVAALAVTRIERALHPEYLIIATRARDGFAMAAGFKPEKAPPLSPASGVREGELRVPINAPGGQTVAVMQLGPRRSEEPYSSEDRELLAAIADSLTLAFAQAPAQPRLQDVELPRVVGGGRYRLERLIGRGGMGLVYEARDLTLDRPVAVKLMRDELVDSEEARRRFAGEARTAAQFSHPNVVTVFDFDSGPHGIAMLVMERLEGHTLRDELTGTPLDPRRAMWVLGGLADAVDAAHARGLLHRDLKPENIFVATGETGECIKILDFGIARSFVPGSDTRSVPTLDGAIVGTPRYMAPEQLAGGSAAASWDIWALAVIAYEMVTGAHPFAGGGAAPIAPSLDAFFRRALAQRPQERFATAHALCTGLEESIDAAGV